jgi:hypothetical protein
VKREIDQDQGFVVEKLLLGLAWKDEGQSETGRCFGHDDSPQSVTR